MGLLLRMPEVWLSDPRRLRTDTGFASAILGLLHKSSDPGFAQQNPRMVRIRIYFAHNINACMDKTVDISPL